MNNYIITFFFFFFFFLSVFMLIFNYLISKKDIILRMKSSPFECGFDMFSSVRLPFSIHFYLIGVLFLIFDVEFIYLFPMIVSLNFLNFKVWFFCSVFIMLILFLGLEYEKKEGSLKWFI